MFLLNFYGCVEPSSCSGFLCKEDYYLPLYVFSLLLSNYNILISMLELNSSRCVFNPLLQIIFSNTVLTSREMEIFSSVIISVLYFDNYFDNLFHKRIRVPPSLCLRNN